MSKPWHRAICTWVALVGGLSQAPLALAAEAPLAVRNVAPTAQLYGLPRMLGAGLPHRGETRLELGADLVSNFTAGSHGASAAFYDGETGVFSARLRHRFDLWELGVEVPWVAHYGGEFDGFIDGFHRLFGFNEGGRDLAPRDQIDYFVQHDGEVAVDFQQPRSGLGDVRLMAGRQLYSGGVRALTVRSELKLATGEAENLTGSGGTDVSVWLEAADCGVLSSLRTTITAGVGVVRLGDGDVLTDQQQRIVPVGHVGLAYRYSDSLVLLAQVDSHSQLIDTDIDQIGGAAVQGTIGLRYRLESGFWLDLSLAEDLQARSAPDAVFQLSLGARL